MNENQWHCINHCGELREWKSVTLRKPLWRTARMEISGIAYTNVANCMNENQWHCINHCGELRGWKSVTLHKPLWQTARMKISGIA